VSTAELYPRLLTGMVLVAAPLALRQPPWLSLGWLAIALLPWWRLRRGRPLPGPWLRVPLALAGFVAVFATYHGIAGRDPGVALLTTMIALKLLELRSLRDLYVAVFLGYFLVMANLLYSQEPPMAVYLLLSVLVLTMTLITANRGPAGGRTGDELRLAGRLLLQGVPIMLALFFLFPRIEGPLWHMPQERRASTGISDEMSPGDISQLVRDDSIAFRAEFDGTPPPPAARYWRGPVMWFTNGRRWRAGHLPSDDTGFTGLGEPVDYAVMLEPSHQRWLFALDLPSSVPADAKLTSDFQVVVTRPLTERRRYRATSYTRYRATGLSPAQRRSGLQLRRVSDRVRALAAAWRLAATSDADVVEQALAFYREQPFVYTLTPPRLGRDPVDEFLFETRRGFCEHYATSFTTLMRAAGIPARVVTGYQGGQVNPFGDYLIVRQSDAHAWAEVWLPDGGWTRVDPTAAVAPERVERAIDADAEFGLDGAVQFRGIGGAFAISLAEQFQMAVDTLYATWDLWVLGYGAARQLEVLSQLGLGIDDWHGITLALALVVGVLLPLIGWSIMRTPRRHRDPAARLYRRFCDRLARRGLARAGHEGPRAFAARIEAARPELAAAAVRITDLYVGLRYAPAPAAGDLATLRRAVQGFRP
jgi:transglutaminase-like putative cysteine protease